jgi:hypothetical protein
MSSPPEQTATLRIGLWNLQKATTFSRKGAAQADYVMRTDADIWVLTEVPADLRLRKGNVLVGSIRRSDKSQCWTAIASRWTLVPLRVRHPTLLLAAARHPAANILIACSVLPWRAAGEAWPVDEKASYSEQFSECLAGHASEIGQASHGYQLIWGGDFNQGLAGREHLGSLAGRSLVKAAFSGLGLMPVTTTAAGWSADTHAIDHVGVPTGWALESLVVERPVHNGLELSDHPAYVATVSGPLASRNGR